MKYARSIVVCLFVIGGVIQTPVSASAATGDQVGSVEFGTKCPSGIGVGITFDGTNLWYSCDLTPTVGEFGFADDLYRANPSTGIVTASYNIAGGDGLGALAYDATRNAIWAGWGSRAGAGTIRLIHLDTSKTVTGTTVAFTAEDAYTAYPDLDDGLAFDAQDDSLYVSPDTSLTIYHYHAVPPIEGSNLIGSFSWSGTGCYNSGLAVGGNLLIEGSNGCSHVWVVNKSTHAASFDFGTGGTRDEGLTCDSRTFAKDVVWSMEAYDSNFSVDEGARRAFAFELPAGTCGVGGKPTAAAADHAAGFYDGVNQLDIQTVFGPKDSFRSEIIVPPPCQPSANCDPYQASQVTDDEYSAKLYPTFCGGLCDAQVDVSTLPSGKQAGTTLNPGAPIQVILYYKDDAINGDAVYAQGDAPGSTPRLLGKCVSPTIASVNGVDASKCVASITTSGGKNKIKKIVVLVPSGEDPSIGKR